MMNKIQFNTVQDLVHQLLLLDTDCRNSDHYLFYQVASEICRQEGINLDSMTFPNVMLHLKDLGIPPFETVRRVRQKLQHDFPKLSGSDKVEAQRTINEGLYKNYARRRV